jgi:hypothetical protein
VNLLLTDEERAAKKIIDALSDLRLDLDYLSGYLKQLASHEIALRIRHVTEPFRETEKKGRKMKTKFKAKCEILSELWLNWRNDEQFEEFVNYNDLGLPLAYAISEGIVSSTDAAKGFINEAFELLLIQISAKDTGFENLEEVLAAEDTD